MLSLHILGSHYALILKDKAETLSKIFFLIFLKVKLNNITNYQYFESVKFLLI